jgi:hypothetical protein
MTFVVAFGAAILRYHEFMDDDYLPVGRELWAVTADPDETAPAPFGHILIGDPADAVERLADTIPHAGRPPLPALPPLPQADTAGPAFTEEAITSLRSQRPRQTGRTIGAWARSGSRPGRVRRVREMTPDRRGPGSSRQGRD